MIISIDKFIDWINYWLIDWLIIQSSPIMIILSIYDRFWSIITGQIDWLYRLNLIDKNGQFWSKMTIFEPKNAIFCVSACASAGRARATLILSQIFVQVWHGSCQQLDTEITNPVPRKLARGPKIFGIFWPKNRNFYQILSKFYKIL